MSNMEISKLITWLNTQKELNQTLSTNTPAYISYHGVYVGKVHAYTDVIEHIELLLKEQHTNI